jgi:purine-binding chemotaxis protein CheW
MVDLVKIRKKARKAKDDEEAAPASLATPLQTVVESSAAVVTPSLAGVAKSADLHPTIQSPQSNPLPEEGGTIPLSTKLERFKEEAGRRRGVAVARQDTVESDQLELLTFVLAGEQYAVDIERIVEIVTPRPITRIPNADKTIVGIVSLRGAIVTLLDVRHKLRHGERASQEDPRIIVIDQKGETIGFEVDRVLRVVKVPAGEVDPHPIVHASEQDDAVRGVFRQGTALTILLDLDKLLNVA